MIRVRVLSEYPAYPVTDDGRVWGPGKGGHGGWLSPATTRSRCSDRGRHALRIRNRAGEWKTVRVHILVALAYLGPRPSGHQVAHWDGDPFNNHVDNLRWATQAENMNDRIRHGTSNRGERQGRATLTDSQVLEIRSRYHAGGILLRELAAEYGVKVCVIGAAVRRDTWAWLQ